MCNLSFSVRPFVLLTLIAMAVYTLSCAAEAAPDTNPKTSINPNGDSELALLMRAMYEDASQMKAAIARGEQPVPSVDHTQMLTAAATEPEKAASDEYQAWARSYLQMLQALENGDPAQKAGLFENLVNNCMGCHTDLCPGPKMRIQHLY